MQEIPDALRQAVQRVVPRGWEVLPAVCLGGKDYHVAIAVPRGVSRAEERATLDVVIDVLMDYDEAHDTYSTCGMYAQRDVERWRGRRGER